MKIRTGFVTNSSSSSYIVVYSVNDSPELRDFVKEEFGNFGLRDYTGSMLSGKEIKQMICDDLGYEDIEDYDCSIDDEIKDDQNYLYGYRVSYTTEGAESDSIFNITDHLPDESCKVVYEGESY